MANTAVALTLLVAAKPLLVRSPPQSRNPKKHKYGLRFATLYGANLTDANLRSANLRYANLTGANLENAKLPDYSITPKTGSFIAYKKVWDYDHACYYVLKLRITKKALRTSSLRGRKCRASKVRVLEYWDPKAKKWGNDKKTFKKLENLL